MAKKKIGTVTYKKRLCKLREELVSLRETAAEATATVELDQTRVGRLSRMDALQGQAIAQETERRRAIEVQRINAALTRIEDGEFGYCVSCGDEIEKERLGLNPAFPTCVGCAR